MNKIFNKISQVLIIFTLTISASWAQNVELLKEFKALNIHYADLKSFSIDFEMNYFDQNGNPVMKQQGNVVHSDEIHYTNVAGNRTLIRDNTYISVNDDSRSVVFNQSERNGQKEEQQPLESLDISATLDSLWENQTNLKYRIIQSKPEYIRVYIEDSQNEYFDAYEITIDRKHKQLLEYVYYFKTTDEEQYLSQIRIKYSNETSRPKLNQEKLKISHYVTKKNKQIELSPDFKNYQLIDQTKILAQYE